MVWLVLVGGNLGIGKLILVCGVVELVGVQVILIDDVCWWLCDCGVIIGEFGVLDFGFYSCVNVVVVYQEVLCKVCLFLGSGYLVIFDGIWGDLQMCVCVWCFVVDMYLVIVEFRCLVMVDVMVDRIVVRVGGNFDVIVEIVVVLVVW